MTRIYVGALAVALLTSCGGSGGSSGALPALPGASNGHGQTISEKQTVVDPVPQIGGASSVTIIEYSVPSFPSAGGIAVTKDGAVWWQTEQGSAQSPGADYMVRMQGSSIETIPLQGNGGLLPENSMTSTPNGRAWGGFYSCYCFGNAGAAGLVYASAGSTQVQPVCGNCDIGFDLPDFSTLGFLTAGPDGNVWFVTAATNEQYQPQCGFFPFCYNNGVSEFGYYSENATTPDAQNGEAFNLSTPFGPSAITTGPDGNMWIAMPNGPPLPWKFYRSTPSGQIVSQMPLPGVLSIADAVTGPDHAVWFTDPIDNVIGRVTVGGSLTTYPVPTANSEVAGITVGGDGAIWFTEENASKIGRITTSGQISEYSVPTSASEPLQIVGPLSSGCGNAQLWFSEQASGKVAQIVVKP